MLQPEIAVIALNIIIVLFAYLFLYSRTAGSNYARVALFDLLATGTSLVIVGSVYFGSETEFSLLMARVNWFWFTVITCFVIEIPMMNQYFKKHGITFPKRT